MTVQPLCYKTSHFTWSTNFAVTYPTQFFSSILPPWKPAVSLQSCPHVGHSPCPLAEFPPHLLHVQKEANAGLLHACPALTPAFLKAASTMPVEDDNTPPTERSRCQQEATGLLAPCRIAP